jgi:hypothetical protein
VLKRRLGIVLLFAVILAAPIPILTLFPKIVSDLIAVAEASVSANEVHSDFNGDGYEDLAIGAPAENISQGDKSGAGTVHVLYGSSPSGLQTASPSDQFLNQDIGNLKDAGENHDGYGSSLAAGDFDSDGFFDLAIGVPSEDISTNTDAGAVHVVYGTSSGFNLFSSNDQFWYQNSPGVEDAVEGGELFGSSLISGDFNGDGYHDLAIGAPLEGIGTTAGAGAVHILYGSSNGLQSASPADQLWHQNSVGVQDSAEEDHFGSALASGDFNNDGFHDLAIGAPFENIGTVVNGPGAVNVLYGSSSGLQTSSPSDQFWHQNIPGVEDSVESGDGFGSALAAGDFNNDGLNDLAIGVPSEHVNQIGSSQGAVNVLYGSSSGLQTSSPSDQFWHQDSPNVDDAAEGDSETFGSALSVGDFNGDDYEDLAIGVPGESVGTTLYAGAVQVLYGSSSGLRASPAGDSTGRTDQMWHQNSPGVEDFAQGTDNFGLSLASGDFNSDGKDELAVGVPLENIGTESDGGAVNVLYGSSSGLQTSSPSDQFWHQNSPGIQDSPEDGDIFGAALSKG